MPGESPQTLVIHLQGSIHESVPLIRLGGSGSLGITLPKDELDKRGIEAGDQVVLLPRAEPDEFTLYFPPEE